MGYTITETTNNNESDAVSDGSIPSLPTASNFNASGRTNNVVIASAAASGNYSTAIGYSTTASGDISTAIGKDIEANGNYTVAIALSDQGGLSVTQSNAMVIMGGNVGIDESAPTAKLDVNGSTGYDQLRLRTSYTPTGPGDTNGNVGDIAWDEYYIYIKTSSGWQRSALSTW